jgi:peptidoglycan/xylan/chitin deacetylase (PgdA/CDA1 family)
MRLAGKTAVRSTMRTLLEIVQFLSAAVYWMCLTIFRKKSHRLIIYYHGVSKQNVRGFEEQMKYLAKTCNMVKTSEIIGLKTGRGRVVVITFDDAFVSVFENAVPILQKYGFTAAVCVPTGNLGEAPQWNPAENCYDADERVMDQQQLCQLDQEGFELLSHGVRHVPLAEIPDSELWSELSHSKEQLEQILGHQVVGISYPHGSWDERVCKVAKQAGYEFGLTIEPQTIDNTTSNLRMGRFAVSPKDGSLKFSLKVSGAYQVTSYLRAAKTRMLSIFRIGKSTCPIILHKK